MQIAGDIINGIAGGIAGIGGALVGGPGPMPGPMPGPYLGEPMPGPFIGGQFVEPAVLPGPTGPIPPYIPGGLDKQFGGPISGPMAGVPWTA